MDIITGKILKLNHWPDGKIIGIAKNIAADLAEQGFAREIILARLEAVRSNPGYFLSDALMADLARECIRIAPKAKDILSELRESPLPYPVWGREVGRAASRFSSLVWGHLADLSHVRDLLGAGAPREVGHNAVGGWMVIVLILALLVQVGSGLFTTDDIAVDGPLVAIAGEAWVKSMTSLHKRWIVLLYILVGLHVLAAVLYLVVKKQNLIAAMITGRKRRDDVAAFGAPVPPVRFGSNVLALVCLVTAAAIVYGVVRLGG